MDHFCNFFKKYRFFSNSWNICRLKFEIEKSYTGETIFQDLTVPKMDKNRKQLLIKLFWFVESGYTTITQEILLHDPKYLLATLGGALSLFIGYSVFDVLVYNLDEIFDRMF